MPWSQAKFLLNKESDNGLGAALGSMIEFYGQKNTVGARNDLGVRLNQNNSLQKSHRARVRCLNFFGATLGPPENARI
jgi:hypothetical protein